MDIIKVNLKKADNYTDFIGYASFSTEPTKNKKALVINDDELKQELDSLFNTKMYERPYLPEYYNPLEDIIGELYTTESEELAIHAINEKVEQFIPRISISSETNFSFRNYKVEMEMVFYYKNDFNKALYSYKRIFDTVT